MKAIAPFISLSGSSSLPSVCTACQLGKSSRLSFPHSTSVTAFPLELLHADVWGYSPASSISGCRFYVIFIDDYSRYCWMFPIQFKSQVFEIFVHFKALVENMFERKIKSFQYDGVGNSLVIGLKIC